MFLIYDLVNILINTSDDTRQAVIYEAWSLHYFPLKYNMVVANRPFGMFSVTVDMAISNQTVGVVDVLSVARILCPNQETPYVCMIGSESG